MDFWEEKLNIKKPDCCKRTATCCQTSTSVKPWFKIHLAANDQNLRDFFNIFVPYKDHDEIKKKFPEAYKSCLEIASSRKDVELEDIYFYHCRFFQPPNICPVYEDRPTLCRNFPESPFDAIPSICGYYEWAKTCKKKYFDLQLELSKLKLNQFKDSSFYLLSPGVSWLK